MFEDISDLETLTIMFFISLAFGTLLSVAITRSLVKPIEQLKDATYKISKGNFDIEIPPSNNSTFDKLINNFNRMVKELKSIETLKSSFVSDVSHDFKTPLSIVQSYSKILRRPNLSKETREKYEQILDNNIQKLINLTTNILSLSKLENQQIVLNKEKFLIDEQIRQCIVALEPEWSKKNIDFELNLEKTEFCWSKSLMESVWSNLISNAIKYSNNKDKITITTQSEDDKIVVIISDTGIGMDSETQKHIFKKFYRGDSSRSASGSGLGLSIVNKVVNLCKGTITVESEIKKGSTFTVILPKK